MAADAALWNGTVPVPATQEKKSVGGPDVVRKPKDDTGELTIIGRASQKAVDFSLIWTRCGISGALFIAVCFASYWCIPWWGENISKPESQARIEGTKKTAEALVIMAEANKQHAENESKRIEWEQKIEAFLSNISSRLENK